MKLSREQGHISTSTNKEATLPMEHVINPRNFDSEPISSSSNGGQPVTLTESTLTTVDNYFDTSAEIDASPQENEDENSSSDGSDALCANFLALVGGTRGNHLGTVLSDAGDVNGDGYADFLIGDPKANRRAGKTYLIFGQETNALIADLYGPLRAQFDNQ